MLEEYRINLLSLMGQDDYVIGKLDVIKDVLKKLNQNNVKQYLPKRVNCKKYLIMKKRIADWLVRFIENNHTHEWISVSSIELKQECRVCGLIKNHLGEIRKPS